MSRQNTVRSVNFVVVVVLIALGGVGAYRSRNRSCARGTPPLRAAVARLVNNDNSGNLQGLLACYSNDAVLVPPQGSVIEGKVALRLHYEKSFTSSKLSLSMLASEAASDGDIGFVRGTTEGTVTNQHDGSSKDINDKFLAVVRCSEGKWRVSHLMWSPFGADK